MNSEELNLIRQVIREEIRKANSEYLTIKEAAAFTKFSTASLYNYVSTRRIPHLKRDGKVLFKRATLIGWLEENAYTPKLERNRRVGNVLVRI